MKRPFDSQLVKVLNAAMEEAIRTVRAETVEWVKKFPDGIPDAEAQEHFRETEERISEAVVAALAKHDGITIKEARRIWAESGATVDQAIAWAKDGGLLPRDDEGRPS